MIINSNQTSHQHPRQNDNKKSSLSVKLACGSIAGIVGTSIIYPLDIVKTRLQNQSKTISTNRGRPPYKGSVDCFRQILRSEGVIGLYRGLLANLIGITPEKAIKLAVNDCVREFLADWHNRQFRNEDSNYVTADTLPIQFGMVAGATAGFCQVVATNPMEIVKIQMQLASINSSHPGDRLSLVQVVKNLGFRGLYRGTTATLLRDVPFSILFFSLHGYFKMILSEPHQPTSFGNVFASGIVAGVIGAAAVTPCDVVKTRLQVSSGTAFSGIADCYRHILRDEGPTALFKGVVPRCMIISPLFGLTLLIYEF